MAQRWSIRDPLWSRIADLVLTHPGFVHRHRLRFYQTRLAFVFEPVALAFDRYHMGVVQQTIEQRCGECTVAGEGLIPLPKGQIGCQDDGSDLIALRNDL